MICSRAAAKRLVRCVLGTKEPFLAAGQNVLRTFLAAVVTGSSLVAVKSIALERSLAQRRANAGHDHLVIDHGVITLVITTVTMYRREATASCLPISSAVGSCRLLSVLLIFDVSISSPSTHVGGTDTRASWPRWPAAQMRRVMLLG